MGRRLLVTGGHGGQLTETRLQPSNDRQRWIVMTGQSAKRGRFQRDLVRADITDRGRFENVGAEREIFGAEVEKFGQR